MKEIKKYIDVIRYGKSQTREVLNQGDYITVTEKLDGANGSFCVDEENPLGISIYSRNTMLEEGNRLRGFYDWCLENIRPIKGKLNKNYRYFGEWLCSHTCIYKEEAYNKFYLFSIWNEVENRYESDEIVKMEAIRLGLSTVPYVYEGEFISYEHLLSFVGKSNLTATKDTGEGVVVKNVKYVDAFGKQCFVKLVREGFAEIQKQNLPKNSKIDDGLREKLKSVLTEARVRKMLFKLIDEGIFEKEDYIISNMGAILKIISPKLLEDIIKEENEMFSEYEEVNLKRTFGKLCPTMVRKLISEI